MIPLTIKVRGIFLLKQKSSHRKGPRIPLEADGIQVNFCKKLTATTTEFLPALINNRVGQGRLHVVATVTDLIKATLRSLSWYAFPVKKSSRSKVTKAYLKRFSVLGFN